MLCSHSDTSKAPKKTVFTQDNARLTSSVSVRPPGQANNLNSEPTSIRSYKSWGCVILSLRECMRANHYYFEGVASGFMAFRLRTIISWRTTLGGEHDFNYLWHYVIIQLNLLLTSVLFGHQPVQCAPKGRHAPPTSGASRGFPKPGGGGPLIDKRVWWAPHYFRGL